MGEGSTNEHEVNKGSNESKNKDTNNESIPLERSTLRSIPISSEDTIVPTILFIFSVAVIFSIVFQRFNFSFEVRLFKWTDSISMDDHLDTVMVVSSNLLASFLTFLNLNHKSRATSSRKLTRQGLQIALVIVETLMSFLPAIFWWLDNSINLEMLMSVIVLIILLNIIYTYQSLLAVNLEDTSNESSRALLSALNMVKRET